MTTMKTIRNWLFAILFVTTAGGVAVTVAVPQTTFAACSERLITFPAWYKGLLNPSTCQVESPGGDATSLNKFIWTIALNIIEMILQLVAYITVAYIIVGGYKYMTSAGSSDGMVKARKTITNAVIGLLLSIFSVMIVNVIAGTLR
jgi:hypothetical protein